jgi:hypothetical protein
MPIFEVGPHFIKHLRGRAELNEGSRRGLAPTKAQSLATLMSGAAGFFMPTTW